MSKVKRICKQCGSEFEEYPNEPTIFCSRVCWRKYNKGVNHPNYKHGKSKGSEFVCLNCGKNGVRKQNFQKYCSTKCQMKYEYKNGTRNRKTITQKAHEKVRELVNSGEFVLQQNWVHIKSNSIQASKKYSGTFIEKKVEWLLKQKNIVFERQKLIYRTEYRRCGKKGIQKRFYIVDFYLPDNNIIIECDGAFWHDNRKEYDIKRYKYLESLGYIILRFSEVDILYNLKIVSDKIDLFNNPY